MPAGGRKRPSPKRAIVEYLIDRFGEGRLRPAVGTQEHLRYRYWLHFAEGSAMPPLLLTLVFNQIKTAPMPFFIKPIARGIANRVMDSFVRPNLTRQFDFFEAELTKSPYFAGKALSGADVMISFPLEAAAQRGGLTAANYPKCLDYLKRIQARPAYARALSRGGPYDFVN